MRTLATSTRHGAAVLAFFLASVQLATSDDIEASMQTYAPKSCKYNPIPGALTSRAFTTQAGEVHVHDVFGLPSTLKRHVLHVDVGTQSLLTVQAEVHRDTPATLSVDVYRRGEVGKPSGRILFGKNLQGSGGEDTKAFVHGLLGEKDLQVDIVFELASVEVAASQVDSRVAEGRCWPVRLDVTAIPTARSALNWPQRCPSENKLPPTLSPAGGSEIVVLGDDGLSLKPPKKSELHYAFRIGDERPWSGFEQALWSSTVEVPPRLHRFVRFFFRTSYRFASGPVQLVLELFDLKDTIDGTALGPKCVMGCLGGVPVFNGQIMDHAMPTGFRYRFWLMAANLQEWTRVIPSRSRQCMEFDLDYSMKYEPRMTPFEVGPAAWLCESSRLPARIVQMGGVTTDKLTGNEQVVAGRTIWMRDRFGFPPDEVADMEHKIQIEVSEEVLFRATTHHSDGVDVFIALSKKGSTSRVCKAVKHPGAVPRQTIFCILQPGSYVLTFFADYPLGGLHPCSDFFAQVALRPTSLASYDQNYACVKAASDLSELKVQRSLQLTTTPRWKAIKVPITFDAQPSTVNVWSQSMTISEEDATKHLYLRLVLHSDYVSSDLRFQVRYEGRYIADTQVTSHGYADMIGPLDPGAYTVDMYYVAGTGTKLRNKLCSTSMADLRIVSQSASGSGNSQWLCTSTRVPPPDMLSPQPEEQVLVDSEYVVPPEGYHTIRMKVSERRLLRARTSSADAGFTLELWTRGGDETLIASGADSLEAVLGKGIYSLKLKANVRGLGSTSACSTFLLNLLLYPKDSLPACPWSSRSSDQSSVAQTQRGADDHIGSLLLDLVPKHLSKETVITPPTSLWMSQGMEKSFPLILDSSAALRLDVVVQPPWLPLEVSVRRKRASGKLEAPVAVAEWTESRLLLMQSDLPKGNYVVEFRQPRTYQAQDGEEQGLSDLCGHVTISAEVGVTSKEAVNTMRSELLDLPDLLAVQPLPPSLNMVGWFPSPMNGVVGTQVYRFADSGSKTTLRVTEESLLRVVSEPADLSNAEIATDLMLNGRSVAQSDSLGQLVYDMQPGSYELQMTPKASAPFLVTMGLASKSRLREDNALMDSGKPCLGTFPLITQGANFSPRGWSIGPVLVRLSSKFLGSDGVISKVPITVSSPSILYIEIGSSLPLDLVRIALQVPEGLWVGEQRGLRNSLQIELPPGKYLVHVAQPKPYKLEDVERCLEFSVTMSASPISPDAAADAAEANSAASAVAAVDSASVADASKKVELGTREEAAVEAAPCFSMGTVPLPLDFSDAKGGSQIMGGPLGQDGRLLMRTHVMLTDMHDGRKKVYLRTDRRALQMKVAITMSGYARLSHTSQLAFSVHPSGLSKAPELEPTETWSFEQGWERVYNLDGSSNGYWLTFHHEHRERSESACVHFGLILEVHPTSDVPRMVGCNSPTANVAASYQDVFPPSLDVTQVNSRAIFRYAKPLTLVQQKQSGFYSETAFSLPTRSFVVAEVGHNFFSSHAEMDIVAKKEVQRMSASMKPLLSAELEALHAPSDPLNAQLVIGSVLEAGDYVLRVADDHYQGQVGDGQACFPFSFEFRARAVNAFSVQPTVMSVQPHPSVPIAKGVDLVLTLRFSEPPEGSIEDVVRKFSLGGVHAVTGGSMNAMEGQYASQKQTTVQVSTAEGHLIWVLGWNAQVLAQMKNPKLRISGLRGNVTKQTFHFNPPTFTIEDPVKGAPWDGGDVKVAPRPTPAPPSSDDSDDDADSSAPPPPRRRPTLAPPDSDDSDDDDSSSPTPAPPALPSRAASDSGDVRPESPGAASLAGGRGDVGRPTPEGSGGRGSRSSRGGAGGDVGRPRPESAASSPGDGAGGVGMPRPERRRTLRQTTTTAIPTRRPSTGYVQRETPSRDGAPTQAPRPRRSIPSAAPASDDSDDLDDDDDIEEEYVAPRVEVWNPDDDSGTQAAARAAARAARTTTTRKRASASDYSPMGDEDVPASRSSSIVPTGYHTIRNGCFVILAAILLVFGWPKLRAYGSDRFKDQTPSIRFQDIGHRTSTEELSLIQAADRYEDDDML